MVSIEKLGTQVHASVNHGHVPYRLTGCFPAQTSPSYVPIASLLIPRPVCATWLAGFLLSLSVLSHLRLSAPRAWHAFLELAATLVAYIPAWSASCVKVPFDEAALQWQVLTSDGEGLRGAYVSWGGKSKTLPRSEGVFDFLDKCRNWFFYGTRFSA